MPATTKARFIPTALATLLIIAGCTSPAAETVTPPPPAPPAVASVSVTGNTSLMTAGSTVQLVATPRDASGTALTGHSVSWTTNAESVATVSTTGLVTAIAAGAATIAATSDGIAGTTAVTVVPVAIASIAITAPKLALLVGDASQYSAQPKDAQGNPLAGRTVLWTSSQPAVATISATGLVTAVGPGTTTIAATNETISANVTVTVALVPVAAVALTAPTIAFNPGDASQYSAQPKDGQGNPLGGRTITWASSQPAVATVSGTGLVTAVATGTSSITAISEGITSTAAVITVTLNPALIEQRVLAQHGLGIGLASTVQQSQLYTLLAVIQHASISGCTALPGGGGMILLSPSTVIPFQIGFYYDAACTRIAVKGTINTFVGDDNLGNYHLTGSALYTSPNGIPQGTLVLDEQANGTRLSGGQLVGTVHALGSYTLLTGGLIVQFGLNCNNLAGGHNIGICQNGVVQNFPGLAAAYGSVTTLGLDSTASGVLTLSGTSVLTSGAIGALTLTQPTATSMVVNGGTAYGTTVDGGNAASFTLFPPTPTGWNVTDAAHDQIFTISLADNTVRNFVGTLKRISTGATLASLALDQSGTGSITYSDGTAASVTAWVVGQ